MFQYFDRTAGDEYSSKFCACLAKGYLQSPWEGKNVTNRFQGKIKTAICETYRSKKQDLIWDFIAGLQI
jgi:hypothetical protein